MKQRIALFALTLLIAVFTSDCLANKQMLNVHPPQIEIKNFKKVTTQPKRKITMQYSLLASKQEPAKALNALIHKTLNQKVNSFIKNSSEAIRNFSSTLQINDSVLFYNPGKLISIQYEQFTFYSGAAHPTTTHFVINYNLVLKKPLSLNDVLQNPKTDLSFIANYSVKALKTKNLGEMTFIKKGAAPTFKNYRNWNFTDKGLLIVFDTYQVAAYVYGAQKVTIPYATLKGHIKSRYFQFLQ